MRIAFFSIVAASLLYSADPTAGAKGTNIANTALSVFGSKDGVNNRLGQPLMSNTKMTTLDGTKSFDAQMQCPASSKSIGITFIPSGGNDYRLIIKQDTNLDGTYDYTYDSNSLARTVSGVCTNGALMCNPAGSWSDCKSFVWDTNNKQVYLRQVTTGSSELGACYCSNSSCGVSTLAPQIYENIGGGISAAIMKSNPLFILSKSEWSFADMTYYLYGQDKTNCTGLGGSNWDKYGEKNPTIYYDAQTPPNTSIADVAIDQGNDPTSYYSMISHQNEVSYNNSGDTIGMPSRNSCVSTKSLKSTITQEYNCNDPIIWNGTPYCELARAGYGLSYSGSSAAVISNIQTDVKKGQSLFAITAPSSNACDNDQSIINLLYSGGVSGTFTASCPTSKAGVVVPIIQNSTASKNVLISNFEQRHSGDGHDRYDIYIYQTNEYKKETLNITESTTCPTDCRLEEEQVCDQNGQNCVYTVRNGSKSGITPQKHCYLYSSDITTGTVCDDGSSIGIQTNNGNEILLSGGDAWFYTKRIYDCGNTDIAIDSSKMTRAAGTAYKTDESATIMTYTDHTGNTVSINNLPSGDECPAPVCTIKRASKSVDQFSDNTNRSQTTAGTSVTETVVKTCTKSGASMTCPTESGETMIEGCSCSGNWTGFQQAVTTLGAVSEAAKDMICSQN